MHIFINTCVFKSEIMYIHILINIRVFKTEVMYAYIHQHMCI